MTENPEFGFGDLSSFTPKAKPKEVRREKEAEMVDAVGDKLGFTARNTTIVRRRKKGVTKPVEQFNLRAHIEDINRFVEFAETNNLSYRKLFAKLVKKLPENLE